MLLRKWNFDTHEYEPFDSPAKATFTYSANMDAPVDCANCGKAMTYGEGFTSRTIHTEIGFGYPVCEDCYNTEWEAERKSKNEPQL